MSKLVNSILCFIFFIEAIQNIFTQKKAVKALFKVLIASGNSRISTENFKTYVSEMMKAEYKGKKVDGIVLWNFDDYFYRINEPKIHEEFSKSKINFDKFYDTYIMSLLNIMI